MELFDSSTLDWGIEIIRAVQAQASVPLVWFFQFITFLGDERFYLLLLPILFVTRDWREASRMTLLMLLAGWLNFELKLFFAQPRPSDLYPDLMLTMSAGYGLPSGHAQLAVVFWGVMAHEMRAGFVGWLGALVLMVLIGFSRILLGVHFPTDVFVGWLVGGLLLIAYLRHRDRVLNRLTHLIPKYQFILLVLLPIGLFAIHPVKQLGAILGAFAGTGLGLVFLIKEDFRTDLGPLSEKLRRALVVVVGTFLFYFGLYFIFPAEGHSLYQPMRFLRYAFVGYWVSYGSMACFFKLGWLSKARLRV